MGMGGGGYGYGRGKIWVWEGEDMGTGMGGLGKYMGMGGGGYGHGRGRINVKKKSVLNRSRVNLVLFENMRLISVIHAATNKATLFEFFLQIAHNAR